MNKKLLTNISVILIVVILLIFFYYTFIYFRVYSGDRITVNYEVSVNGYDVNEIDVYYRNVDYEKIKVNSDGNSFKLKGGRYGMYETGFVIDNEVLYKITDAGIFEDSDDVVINLGYMCTNWWYISEINIDFDIIENNDEFYLIYNISLTEPKCGIIKATVNETDKISIEKLSDFRITIGG